ncbi:NAD-dependent epimerase/dehydratase family protein [Mycobacterium intracellulare]|uniref:NAD-dependent epimerase/dehydratase family protein n=1 Tax=Mycobacterium intracellulare TaxID=1767 RepID=UPI0019165A21|nr:NAD(P)-dependent oxidoreductase [Mycobacterium intracellulare]MCA2355784.1 NAD(P)-dependent oxidoreductase [Mycobacterium intracellulare]MCA2365968.1 NAD(P)-dependent oxidoreductase [Mycobacterium intracellulare]
MTDSHVLVTGAFGQVGTAVVSALSAEGHTVTATDLDNADNRRREAAMTAQPGVQVWWADLTNAVEVDRMVRAVAPSAVIHLAAIIPPFCYARRDLARVVNVDATAHLIAAASAISTPPRFALASSVAVYGARNPHCTNDLLTVRTQRRPSDLYGSHKVMAEDSLMSSDLDWVVLRLGGVLTAQPRWRIDPEMVAFEALLPTDGRIHTVDVRDVAAAFVSAATKSVSREVFLIGGDATHRITQGAITADITAAMGLRGGMPPGRPGDPRNNQEWFATDWMDTAASQDELGFQCHSLPDMFAELRRTVGWRRWPLHLVAPVTRAYLSRRAHYRGIPGRYAQPWQVISERWGDPGPDAMH